MRSESSICIVSPSLSVGGIERALVVLANFMDRRDYSVTFISCLSGEAFYPLETRVEIIMPNFKPPSTQLGKVFYYPRLLFFIRKAINKAKPDKVLVFGDLFSPLVLLALLGMSFPVYISDRTSPDFKLKKIVVLFKRWLYPKAKGFIAQTESSAVYKKTQFGNKLNIRVIPNAIRTIKLYPEIEREKIILYVGRLSWEKGPDRLIQAFHGITDREGWQLHLAGSGPLLSRLQRLVFNLGLEKEVYFLGNVSNIDETYAAASIYVLPSQHEGFPNALCEAMAAGLPCICFETIPYKEIFTNGVDGLAVNGDDTTSLTQALALLMSDEKLRMSLGKEAQKIRTKLDVNIIGPAVIDFIFEG